jgi:hypothetical protein
MTEPTRDEILEFLLAWDAEQPGAPYQEEEDEDGAVQRALKFFPVVPLH